jgi:hypothetical protein
MRCRDHPARARLERLVFDGADGATLIGTKPDEALCSLAHAIVLSRSRGGQGGSRRDPRA